MGFIVLPLLLAINSGNKQLTGEICRSYGQVYLYILLGLSLYRVMQDKLFRSHISSSCVLHIASSIGTILTGGRRALKSTSICVLRRASKKY